MARKEWDDTEWQRLRTLAREGKHLSLIARTMNRTPSCILQRAREAGIELTDGRKALSNDEILLAEQMFKDGFSYQAVAARLGRSPATIRRLARAAGLPIRRYKDRSTTVWFRWMDPKRDPAAWRKAADARGESLSGLLAISAHTIARDRLFTAIVGGVVTPKISASITTPRLFAAVRV